MRKGMRLEEKYIASHRPYLLNPDTFTNFAGRRTVKALWFRKRHGDLYTTYGELWDYSDAETFDEFIEKYATGRYGGDPIAQWAKEGESLWTPEKVPFELVEEHIAFLRPIAEAFPEIPAGWRGWYDIRDL